MSRSIRPAAARSFLAFARSLLACVTLLACLAPSAAWALTPYSIRWVRTQAAGSCEIADLGQYDGEAYFAVNDTPIPTYQIPGALVQNPDGSQNNVAEAPFGSVLLRVGANGFRFSIFNESGDDSCVLSHEVATLTSAPLGLSKPLFDVVRNGQGFAGNTLANLTLAEINPPLAQDIANLEAAIAADQAKLLANAAVIEDLAGQLATLRQLDAELRALVNRPLDQITPEDLDAILDRYDDVVSDETRAALHQLLEDLQKSIDDLHAELASLIESFGDKADATADLLTAGAAQTGFHPDDPSAYSLGYTDVPPVAIPSLSGVPGAFDPANDPYDAYANAVIAALADDVSGAQVTDRPGFVAQVRAWRANSKAIGDALTMAGASQAETSAFLKSQDKIRAYVQKFMDAQDWFKDSPVPADVRGYIAGVFKNKFDKVADELKDALNSLPTTDAIDLTALPVFQTIRAFGGAMAAIDTVATPYFEMMATLVHATTRVAIGFVPVVGPALDFCEAATGRAWCLPDGEELSTEERIFSGAGVAAGGLAKFWGGVKNAGLGAKTAAVATSAGKLDEAMALQIRMERLAAKMAQKGFQPSRRMWWKTLTGAITSGDIDPFEAAGIKLVQARGNMLLGVGDDGVREVLKKYLKDGEAAADLISITDPGNKIAITEMKSGKKILHAVKDQIRNVVVAIDKAGWRADIAYVEVIVEKAAKFDDANWIVKDGYLFDTLKNKRVEVPGFPNLFVKATEQ